MAKLALYQKYRSTTFDEVVGQEYIVQSIKNAIHENRVGHAYLFCGPRGTGKTTMARLLAKAVNCEHPAEAPCCKCDNCIAAANGTHPDIIEINAANETHVEDIRDLIERSTLAPMQGKHKVYIVDEVHQLSGAAASALLKTLEEPPENVIFILATTDPQKLLATIISRCQRYDFTKVPKELIQKHILHVSESENITIEPEAAEMIATLADGGMRDALSILDQCAAYTSDHITIDDIDRIYGLTTVEEKVNLLFDIANKDIATVITRIQSYEQQGVDMLRFTDGLVDVLKEAVIYQSTHTTDLLKLLSSEQASRITQTLSASTCMHMSEKLLDSKPRFRNASSVTTAFEVTCLSLITEDQDTEVVQTKPASMTSKKQEPKKETQPVEEVLIEEDNEPVQEMVIEKKPEIEIIPVEELNNDLILSLLVQCDKKSKASDENTMAMLSAYSDLSNRKYISLLEGTKVGASGPNCLILLTEQQAVANRINETKMNRELYFFMKDTMKTDKMIYAVVDDQFLSATKEFVTKHKQGTLPEPRIIEKYQEEKNPEDDVAQKVMNLFGKDNVKMD